MRILLPLAEWVLRSSVLILCGTGLLWILRVKDAAIRLTAWTALLAGSLAIPALTLLFPTVPIVVTHAGSARIQQTIPVLPDSSSKAQNAFAGRLPESVHAAVSASTAWHFDWTGIAVAIYCGVALLLLLRLVVGVVLTRRLLRNSGETGQAFRESNEVAAPAVLGILRPVIVLPHDWHAWEEAKLGAVLAHERAHIRRHDPAIQMLSAIHRALLWIGPLSWFLHNRIVRTAEEASDNAAVAATQDRAFYAEVLLGFMQRGIRGVNWLGVPMARYGRADRRIRRVLDGMPLSPRIKPWAVAAIMAVTPGFAYLVATARPSEAAPQAPVRSAPAAPVQPPPAQPAQAPPQAKTPEAAAGKRQEAPVWLNGLGNVSATTVNVTARVDGQLASVSFVEGGPVEAGQLLASVELPQFRALLDRAMNQLSEDRKTQNVVGGSAAAIRADEVAVSEAQRQLAYGQIRAPLAGVAGLRKVDPGNFVHAGDSLVVITQLQPIAVVFSLPEDAVPQAQVLLRSGATPVVEAWNRDNSVRLATGRLTAIDNEIDINQGTIKLKASFDNKDGALFPNQFVNVRVLLTSQ
jgi:multidrug efflux pump subunit AcrA (membrane-fusion protein)/beta-lactamase regulating signal transducer with metallopeptidase domain